MLGFGGSVASLKATLTLDDDGFIRGMADASAKLDAYNARLKEQGVGSRMAAMASRDYATQLYKEAKAVDQTSQSHGRLVTTLQNAQRHWKLLSAGTAAAGLGIVALTGHIGTLTGLMGQLGTAVLPAVSTALTGMLSPFTSLAAVVVGLMGPMSALVTLFGVVGAGAGLGLYKALTGTATAFLPVRKELKAAKEDFHLLGVALGKDFLPYAEKAVTWADRFLKYGVKLAGMNSLGDVIRSISHEGMAMLEHLNRAIYNMIGKPLLEIFTASFGKAGNRISHAFDHMLSIWEPLVSKMWGVFSRWFDRQHFEQTGATWAAAIVNTAVPVIASAMWAAVKSEFSNLSAWGKIGMIAGAAFAANFFSGGLLSKGLLAGGKGLIGLFGSGAAGAGAAGAGEVVAGGGAAAGGGGILATLGAGTIATIAAAAVPVAMIAAEAWASSHASRLNPAQRVNQIYPGGKPTTQVTGEAAFGQARFGHLISQDLQDAAKAGSKYAAELKKIEPEQKSLNQFIRDGGKSVAGWKIAMQQASNQGRGAEQAIHGLAQNGFISASKAAADSKQSVQTFIGQMDSVARKATTASQNTAKFGASTRAQYAHVAALARTSADLAAAINSIPSSKYVSLVLSITENLRSQGNAPGQTPTGIHQTGAYISGPGSGDIVPAMLEPGEGVLNRNAVAALGGKSAIDAINSAVPRFQSGGLVPPRRHKKEKRNAYRGRVSNWLSNTVTSQFSDLDFGLQIADRIAQRDDQEGKFGAEITQLNREQTIRGKEIRLYDRARHVAHRFGLAGLERQYAQDAAFVRQDELDAALTIKGLRGQTSTSAGGASVAAQIAAFLAEQQSFISQFGSNIKLPGAAQNVTTSGTPTTPPGRSPSRNPRLPNRTAGGSGGVIIHNHFTQTPPDSFAHLRKARIQAAAVFG